MRPELNERQNRIMDLLERDGEIKVGELKEQFDVAEMTIRRDLEKLEQLGLLRRTFGGAIPITPDVSLKERTGFMTEEKVRIGRAAAALVQAGQAIFIDAGTTTFQVARQIKPGSDITVVTNALNVAAELVDKQIHTIVIGGLLLEKTMSLVGPMAIEALDKMAFDQVFLGAAGLTLEHGFSNSNVLEAELKKKAIAKASSVNIVMDHTKFGIKQLHSFTDFGRIHRLVTDGKLPEAFAAGAVEANIEIVND